MLVHRQSSAPMCASSSSGANDGHIFGNATTANTRTAEAATLVQSKQWATTWRKMAAGTVQHADTRDAASARRLRLLSQAKRSSKIGFAQSAWPQQLRA